MKVFKFGGASVKDANGVKNVASIIKNEQSKDLIVVISAMGKMTNAFEKVIDSYYNSKNSLNENLTFIKEFHINICNDLFPKKHPCFDKINQLFTKLTEFLNNNSSTNYNLVYDQIVSYGELLSTTIVSEYLLEQKINNNWLDVRTLIKTDATYRDAKVDWKSTEQEITKTIQPKTVYLTQGFLGGNENNTTTLGREGSDFSAGIFAYCLNAESVTIWKDVNGVLNADPRVFSDTTLLQKISYTEAIEMAFYGASVIHPKTIQPLKQKNISLFVRSFINQNQEGTQVTSGIGIKPKIPCFIVKKNQLLISISAKDFSFIMEDNISTIFKKLHDNQLKVNLIQNSAINFSVCIDDKFNNYDNFISDLKENFNIITHENVNLYTIRHFDKRAIAKIEEIGIPIIKQINTETVQLVLPEQNV